MKKWKKVLRFGLLAAVLTATLCVSASALTEGNFQYTLSNNEAYLTGLVEYTPTVNVPATLGGAPVVKIEKSALTRLATNGSHLIEEVTLPNTIREIGDGAFWMCENMRSINMPTSLRRIGEDAFKGCKSLTSIQMSDNVTEIGKYAFYGCTSLSDVKLSHRLTEISNHTFENTLSLENITIPLNINKLGDEAFARSGLTSINLHAGMKLGVYSFYFCESLSQVTLPSDLREIPLCCFEGCTSLKNVDIPTTVKSIGLSSFDKSGIEKMIIPYGVSDIQNAFVECDSLTELYVPSTLKISRFHSDMFSPFEIPNNCIVYCAAGSEMAKACSKFNISYKTDSSVDSRVNVLYNGKRISFGATGQNPVIQNGRTLVPLRAIFETMGATVNWDNATRTVTATRSGTTVKLTLGDKTLYKNGKAVMTLDVPAKALNGRTVVPARAVAEAFGAKVEWNSAAKLVQITE